MIRPFEISSFRATLRIGLITFTSNSSEAKSIQEEIYHISVKMIEQAIHPQ